MRWKQSIEEPHRAQRDSSFYLFSCHLTQVNTVLPPHLSYTLTPTLSNSSKPDLRLLLIQHPCWHSHGGEQVWATRRTWEKWKKPLTEQFPDLCGHVLNWCYWREWLQSKLEWQGKCEGFLNWYFKAKLPLPLFLSANPNHQLPKVVRRTKLVTLALNKNWGDLILKLTHLKPQSTSRQP